MARVKGLAMHHCEVCGKPAQYIVSGSRRRTDLAGFPLSIFACAEHRRAVRDRLRRARAATLAKPYRAAEYARSAAALRGYARHSVRLAFEKVRRGFAAYDAKVGDAPYLFALAAAHLRDAAREIAEAQGYRALELATQGKRLPCIHVPDDITRRTKCAGLD